MLHSHAFRRTAAAVAIAAVGGLAAVPAAAADPVDVGAAKHGNVEAPAVDAGRLRNDIDTPLSPSAATPAPVDPPSIVVVDDGLEYVQIGLGALAGAAFTAAGIAALGSRRRQGAPRPA
jgi:hypothetical protein